MIMVQRVIIGNGDINPHFIGAWQLEDNSLCDKIIEFFDANPLEQNVGAISGGVDENKKKTRDIAIKPKLFEQKKYSIFNTYVQEIIGFFADYKDQWPFLTTISGIEIGTFNVQKYAPGGHFNAVHTERSGADTQHRLLAFMTYLNNVDDGGETHFTHFNIKIKPAKGKTLIWPAEWTHAHSGGLVAKGNKYIVTGWIQFA
jgi:hypothetical protein